MRLAILALPLLGLVAASAGCAMCANPFDYAYSAYGGRWQRVDVHHGRVGSVFTPVGTYVADHEEIVPAAPAPPGETVPTPTPAPAPALPPAPTVEPRRVEPEPAREPAPFVPEPLEDSPSPFIPEL